jgi:predicted O-methyltransferase YrrM
MVEKTNSASVDNADLNPPAEHYELTEEEKATMSNRDRMLPSQPVMRRWFRGGDESFIASLESLINGVLPVKSVGERWNLELKPGVSYSSLGSDMATLTFLQFLIRVGKFKSILELGTFIGASTLFLAEAAGPGGIVTTVERGEEFYEIAKRNFARNQTEARINPILDKALEVLQQDLDKGKTYDFIIMDAGKEDYAKMLAPAVGCLSPGGILVVDDVFMSGDTLNAMPSTDKGRGVKQMLLSVASMRATYQRVILPMGNGLMLLTKPSC